MLRATVDNQTQFPNVPVRQTVRWVLRELGVDTSTAVIRIEPWRNERTLGKFYANGRNRRPRVWARKSSGLKIPDEARHLIVARLSWMQFPGRRMRGGPPPFLPQNWVESLISITAHEAMHLRQFLFTRSGSPKFSETEAEWASYRLLKKWRERRKDGSD